MILGQPLDLTPEELAGTAPVGPAPAVPPVLGAALDPLDDFDVFNAVEDEKERLGYDPADPGLPSKIYAGMKGVVSQIPAAVRGMGTLAKAAYAPGGAPEAVALTTAAAGRLLANYNQLGRGAVRLAERGGEVVTAALGAGDEANLKQLSRRAAYDFGREARGADEFAGNFNQHLETLFPEVLKGLGAVPVDPGQAEAMATLGDPSNYVPTAAAARWTTQVPLSGAVRAARLTAREAALDVAKAGAEREAATLLLRPGARSQPRGALVKAAATATEALTAAQKRQAEAMKQLADTVASQRGVVDELALSAAAQPPVTRLLAAGAQGAGRLGEAAGAGLQRLAAVPDQLAAAVAGGAEEGVQKGIADGVRNVAGVAGVLPASAGLTGSLLRNAGRNLKVYGRVLAEAEGQLPFFKAVARQTDGMSSYAASLVDQSGFGDLITPVGRIAAETTRGLPFAAAMGYAGSGGEVDAAASGMGGGMAFGLAGGAYGQWRRFANPGTQRLLQTADVTRYRKALPTEEVRGYFDKLPTGDRTALATIQLAHPDLAIKYEKLGQGRPSFYYAAEDGPVAVVNLDTRDGLSAVVAHEVGHHVEKHGLAPVVDRLLFGDPVLQQAGLFSELDAKGRPVVGPDGGFARNAEWTKLKESYNGRLAAHVARTGEALPARGDADIAREVFAEHTADYLLGNRLPRDLRSNVWSRTLESLADSSLVGSAPMLKQALGKLGVPLASGGRVSGSGLFPGGLPASPQIQRLVRDYHQKSARNAQPDLADEKGGTRYTAAEVAKHPEVLDKLFNGSDDVQRDKLGRVIREKDGTPRFLRPAEQQAQRKALADALAQQVAASPAANGARTERVVNAKTGVVEEGLLLPGVPDDVLDNLKARERFNPAQIEHLREVSKQIRAGAGQSSLFFYQPATPGGGRYKSLAGDWRTETPYAIFVSKAGNVLVRTMSREKLIANAQAFVAKRQAALWDNQLPALVRDVETYLANHAAGRPGSDKIGAAKRDQINALFGIGTQRNLAANPFLESSPRSPVIIRSRRLDRINRLTPVEETFRTDYDRLNANLRPERAP